jgi:uncharacterized protein with HEPN domain
MRRDLQFLEDIREAAEAIERFAAGSSGASFSGDDVLRSAVLHKLTVIGEAAARVTAALRERHPEVPWSDVVGFRNVVVHAYFALEWSIVWTTATEEVPQLRRQISRILELERGDG